MDVFVCMYVPGALGGQKRSLNLLELELKIVVSHVVAGN